MAISSISFGQATFQTINGAVVVNSISQGNITGLKGFNMGQSFVIYNGQEYDIQPSYGVRGIVALRGTSLLTQFIYPSQPSTPEISRNNEWQSNSGWNTYLWMSNGGNSNNYLQMYDFSDAGTSVGTIANKSYFFDANGTPTEISLGISSTSVLGVYGNKVVGQYGAKGYVWENGNVSEIYVPNSFATRATGIYQNIIVGNYYTENNGSSHGFLYDGANYFTLDAPGAVDTFFEDISGNQAVGSYRTADGVSHGFVANSVPEPSSLSLLVLGGVVVALRRRK